MPGLALPEPSAFLRLWQGFMTARAVTGMALLLLEILQDLLGMGAQWPLLLLCLAYAVLALGQRLQMPAASPQTRLDPQWHWTIAPDVVLIASLQLVQAGSMNYLPLFALPVLQASVLGTRSLALATASAVTLILLGETLLTQWISPQNMASPFLQSALTGTGYLVLALLSNELASRLAREEQVSRTSQLAARVQAQVNDLVIEALHEGALVLEASGQVLSTNPTARALLAAPGAPPPLQLRQHPAWQALQGLVDQTFASGQPQHATVSLALPPHHSPRHLLVRTRITPAPNDQSPSLCVMFLQDLREIEAQLRAEKMLAMGRMSAAVAHEIRNPLAAIAQANALLEEDLRGPAQQQLTRMIAQNAERLSRIVDEVLNISRVQQHALDLESPRMALDPLVRSVAQDWHQARPHAAPQRLCTQFMAEQAWVVFDPDHLRRILINLLDNAARYASDRPGAIHIVTRQAEQTDQPHVLEVWSDGAPLDPTVQLHLFEPFFSSESRSSGLGLYICRELCVRHGARISHQRLTRGGQSGNAFLIEFRSATAARPAPAPPAAASTRPAPHAALADPAAP